MNRRCTPLLLLPCLLVSGCFTKKAGPTAEAVLEAPGDAATAPAPGEPFQFPNDATGALLAKNLSPAEPKRLLPEPIVAPQPYPAPASVAVPSPPLAPSQAALPTVPAEPIARVLRPHLVSDESSFSPREELSLPQAAYFPVPTPVRLASRDPNKPVPLPPLARPTPDRAPTDDPTGEASARAALASPLPARSKPAPFTKIRLVQSYEERAAVRLPVAPPDTTSPAARATPKTPGK
jgi:hypothetical protein